LIKSGIKRKTAKSEDYIRLRPHAAFNNKICGRPHII